jgi:hypothetical protein
MWKVAGRSTCLPSTGFCIGILRRIGWVHSLMCPQFAFSSLQLSSALSISLQMLLLYTRQEDRNRERRIKHSVGHAIAQAVSRWLPTTAARVQTRV